MDIETLIDKVTTQTIIKAKKSKLINNYSNNVSLFKKTETVLKNYKSYEKLKDDESVKAKRLVNITQEALKTIENDDYYEIIEKIYFEKQSRETVAEYFDCDVKTITRNKRRLVNELKVIIFSDESIEEIFDL